MNRIKLMIIALCSVGGLAVSFVSGTFAWLSYSKKMADIINVDSGSLKLNSVSLSLVKFVYPDFSGGYDIDSTSLIDFNASGRVKSKTLLPDSSVSLNLIDPTYMAIYNASVSSLNTNVVLKVSFSLDYDSAVKLSFTARKTNPLGVVGTALPVSEYLDFTYLSNSSFIALPEPDMSLYDPLNETNEDYVTYHKTKTYSELGTTYRSSFGGTSFANIVSDDHIVASRPASPVVGGIFSFYVGVDYSNETIHGNVLNGVADLFDSEHIGLAINLYVDYAFYLSVTEVAA